jgi:hypothetical protein
VELIALSKLVLRSILFSLSCRKTCVFALSVWVIKIYCDSEENFVAEVKICHAKIMMSANAMMNRYRKNFFIKTR